MAMKPLDLDDELLEEEVEELEVENTPPAKTLVELDDEDSEVAEELPKEDDAQLLVAAEEKRKNRTKDRINKLLTERDEAFKETERLKNELDSLKKSTKVLKKSAAENQIESLKRALDITKRALKQATSENDVDKMVDLQSEMHDLQLKVTAYEQLNDSIEEDFFEPAPAVKHQQQSRVKLEDTPEALQDWVSRNPWFLNPRTAEETAMVRAAVGHYDLLVAKGYDPESDELYDLVDAKLGLDSGETNGVQSNYRQPEKTNKQVAPQRKVISQTIQGASRTSISPKKSVALSDEEKSLARLYKMTPKEYAKEKLKIEEARKQGKRMTSLFPEEFEE